MPFLRRLNERLMAKLVAHKIDFSEDLRATKMEIPPDNEGPKSSAVATPVPAPQPMPPQTPLQAQSSRNRPGHTRTSSNVSASQFPMQPPLNAGLPMSAPSHTASLPDYPSLPISTPASPQKASMGMAPPMSVIPPPGSAAGVTPLNLSFPMTMHAVPSPSSSASSSAPRHSIYSPSSAVPYSDDPSSSDSFRGSAMSSQVGVNVAHLSLQEQQALLRQQQSQHGSAPHSPSHTMVGFNNPSYVDPAAPYRPEVQYGNLAPPGYGNPGLGLNVPGHVEGMSGSNGYNMSHDLNGMPPIPGAFPHEETFAYQHHQLGRTLSQHPSFGGSVEMMYNNAQEGQMAPDYSQTTISFGHDGGSHGGEQFLPTSPHPSQGSTPPQHMQHYTNMPSQHGGGGMHLSVSMPSGSSPSNRSPLHPHLPLGAYQDSSNRPESGIAPSMLVGSDSGPGGQSSAGSNIQTSGDNGASTDGNWYHPDGSFTQS